LDSRENIKTMVSSCKTAGINHLFIVVYNNARTIYPSTVMQNLIGKQQLRSLWAEILCRNVWKKPKRRV
jgi:uncharacterized lipoprotein YddW (UPF0748 family)